MDYRRVLKTVVNYGLAVYLISHGLSPLGDSQPELWELATALWARWWLALR